MEKIPPIIHESWHQYLQPLFDDKRMTKLKYEILPSTRFYPKPDEIFRVFSMPIDRIKVVILGQDVYPNGEGIGIAFAVNERINMPGSLRVIQQEIINSGVERDTSTNVDTNQWKTLKHWRQQGIFLINAGLTVQVGASGSHLGYWKWFTQRVVQIISLHYNPVWLMWGAKAKGYIGLIHKFYKWRGELVSNDLNYVLEADHPAAELYPDSRYKFSGCNHFKLCNQILKLKKQSIINW